MPLIKRRQFLETITGTSIGVIFGEHLISTAKEVSSSGLTLAQFRRRIVPPPPVYPQPVYKIRIHAIVTGTSKFTAADVQSLLDEANKIYASAGIQFICKPGTDIDVVEPGSSLAKDDMYGPEDERTKRALSHRGKLVIFFRDKDKDTGKDAGGGYSSPVKEFAAMYQGSSINIGRLLAHELGHYFHLGHTFVENLTIAKAEAQLKDWIQQQPEAQKALENRQLIPQYIFDKGNRQLYKILDGDSKDNIKGAFSPVEDTPPNLHGEGDPPVLVEVQCNANANFTVPITVTFDNGQSYTYNFQPDRSNIMGYYKDCLSIPQRFSTEQVAVMRASMQRGNRNHLIDLVLQWSRWADVQGNGRTDAAPAAAALSNQLYAFVKGLDNHIYYNMALDGQPFRGWVEVQGDGRTDAAPAAVAGRSSLYAFIKGLDNRIYYNASNASVVGQPFMGWVEVQGDGRTNAAPAATAGRNQIYVFIKGLDNRIYYNSTLDGQPSRGWIEVQGDGRTDATPAAATFGNQPYAFIKGLDNRIYYNSTVDGQPSRGWVEVQGDGRTDAAPAAGTFGNQLYVFIKGLDNRIYHNSTVDGQSFRGWREIPGDGITDAAPAVALLNNILYGFVKGPTGRIFHNSAAFI